MRGSPAIRPLAAACLNHIGIIRIAAVPVVVVTAMPRKRGAGFSKRE